MGQWFSKDYEAILESLETQIKDLEGTQTENKHKESASITKFTLYSVVLLFLFILYAFTLDSPLEMPVALAGSVFIYYGRKIIRLLYSRKKKSTDEKLATLRKQQMTRVEELKRKTSFNVTKALIEKYETPTKKSTPQRIEQQNTSNRPLNLTSNASLPPLNVMMPPSINQHQQPLISAVPLTPSWIDKLTDAVIGDADESKKFALVCIFCHRHNGLVSGDEYEDMKFVCRYCEKENPSRRTRKLQKEVAYKNNVDETRKDSSSFADINHCEEGLNAISFDEEYIPETPCKDLKEPKGKQKIEEQPLSDIVNEAESSPLLRRLSDISETKGGAFLSDNIIPENSVPSISLTTTPDSAKSTPQKAKKRNKRNKK